MWIKDYLGTIQFDPAEELMEIPNHSAFFILSPDNRLTNILHVSVYCVWVEVSISIDGVEYGWFHWDIDGGGNYVMH